MTSGGKVRIYELSRDLGLDNRDVLNARKAFDCGQKPCSSISDGEAAKIKALLNSNGKAAGGAKSAKPEAGNQILSLKKAPSTPSQSAAAPLRHHRAANQRSSPTGRSGKPRQAGRVRRRAANRRWWPTGRSCGPAQPPARRRAANRRWWPSRHPNRWPNPSPNRPARRPQHGLPNRCVPKRATVHRSSPATGRRPNPPANHRW